MELTRRETLQAGTAAVAAAVVAAPAPISAASAPPRAPLAPRSTRLAAWRFHLGHAGQQALDFNFGRRNSLSEVEEHLSSVRAPGVSNIRSLVETIGGQVDAIKVCGTRQLAHWSILPKLLTIWC